MRLSRSGVVSSTKENFQLEYNCHINFVFMRKIEKIFFNILNAIDTQVANWWIVVEYDSEKKWDLPHSLSPQEIHKKLILLISLGVLIYERKEKKTQEEGWRKYDKRWGKITSFYLLCDFLPFYLSPSFYLLQQKAIY